MRPQYRPLRRRCSVNQYSYSSLRYRRISDRRRPGHEATHSVEALDVFDMLVNVELELFRQLAGTSTTPTRAGY